MYLLDDNELGWGGLLVSGSGNSPVGSQTPHFLPQPQEEG